MSMIPTREQIKKWKAVPTRKSCRLKLDEVDTLLTQRDALLAEHGEIETELDLHGEGAMKSGWWERLKKAHATAEKVLK